MYVSDLLRGLLRRWYVILAGLALTAGGAFLVFGGTAVKYEAHATMMLLPPEESLGIEGSNPYLILGGMGQALAVLTTRLNSPETRDLLLGDDETLDYGTAGETTAGAPFLTVTTQALDDDLALSLLDDVEAEAERQLVAMQSELDIGAESVISIMYVTSDIEATRLASTRMQLTLATAAAGVVLTIVAAAVVEGLAGARARKRAALNAPLRRQRDPHEPLSVREALGQSAADDGDGSDPGDADDLDDTRSEDPAVSEQGDSRPADEDAAEGCSTGADDPDDTGRGDSDDAAEPVIDQTHDDARGSAARASAGDAAPPASRPAPRG